MPKGIYERKSIEERFLPKFVKGDDTECWLWTASMSDDGYGFFTDNKKTVQAHRFSYQYYKKESPEGKLVRHTCDTRNCVNPNHLVLGDPADNSRDMTERNRQQKGEKHYATSLTQVQVTEIKEKYEKDKANDKLYGSLVRIAKKYGVSKQVVYRIVSGQTWN